MSLIPPSAPGAAQKEFKPRLVWATGIAVLAFVVLVGRLYQLQILQGDEYKERADENFVKELRVPADRGLVLDRNRRVLVDSRPSYDVTLTPYFCGKQCDDILSRLATMLQMSPDEMDRAQLQLKNARKLERFRPFTVKVDISREELDRYLSQQMELPGVDVQPVPHRNYRYAGLGGHLIGYMNEVGADELKRLNEELERTDSPQGAYLLGDYVGRRGLERRYERELRGIDGKERIPVDAKGRRKDDADNLIPEDQRLVPSTPGDNLVLSLDWRLQEFAEKTFPATAGVVLAMDAKTGFLLVLVDRPAPDPNKMSGRITSTELAAIHSDPLQPELFRAIQQHYHPGSTFKALTSIAALEEGVYKPNTTVFCPGHFSMGRARWRCDKDSGHGYVDFEHALGASCDVFFYQAGALLGADAIAKWARKSGLGAPTGFDIAGEIPGVIPDAAWHDAHIPGGYQKGMAVNLSIGQGDVNVTPMQQLVFYAALATGKIWRPQVVQRIEDADGKVLQEFAPDVRSKLDVQPSTRETVLKGLFAAVNQPFGTGYYVKQKELKDVDVTVSGKTGTAQVVKLGARRLKAEQVSYFERDHAWFAAFAPAEDPEIVVVVLNEHSGFGASNAAPTAMALIRRFLELKKEDAAERAGPAAAPAPLSPGAPPPSTPPPAAKPPTTPEKPKLGAGVAPGAGQGARRGA
ncbi:penicillin-binding protein 2 [Anaeromyxobacter oryzae]|uniref:Penicillin-binding protein 2 n=1 Tax=Anaeromyxobacter oryzae TaxID=2918170 RepID=A0ABM7WQL3_9BACT|nr:penicillin-binding protein 2 [Anaeromyxobacter oryzae]BDG01757.1 penicillin-binding protein 2 [Anaeromyxobacter oryzae]